jgi:hypothetical protein
MPITLKTLLGMVAVGSLIFNAGYAVDKVSNPNSGGWLGGGNNGNSESLRTSP